MLHSTPDHKLVCPVCHLGHLHIRMTTYMRQFGETLVNVPNIPAWECDVCHQREFDPVMIQRIEVLVGQAGPPPNKAEPAPHTPNSEPVENVKLDNTKITKTRTTKSTKGSKSPKAKP